jgi:uncharacterized protein (DUF362 family)
MRGDVAIARCLPGPTGPYPAFPYAPGEAFGELPRVEPGPPNPVFAAVRSCLARLGLDRPNFGTPRWDPFGDFIQPGQQVLIKPNWVFHENRGQGGFDGLVTHTSVLRPVIDYVLRALDGRGRVIIGDAPLQSADFGTIVERTAIERLANLLRSDAVPVEVRDFRENACELDGRGRVAGHHRLAGDPDGYSTVDLGKASHLADVADLSSRFRVTNYDPAVMRSHHSADRHEYLVAKAMLASHVVINVPKLKTHRKAGLTCCLKNLVGINGSKDYLPHHRVGPVARGGDEYCWPSFWKACAARLTDRMEGAPASNLHGVYSLAERACRRMARCFQRDPYSEGSWHGNDTVWRMALDLNHLLEYARPDGTLADVPQRRVFNVVDAVVAGEGEGPLRPDAVAANFVLAGEMPAAVDACAARLVGLDPDRIPLVRNGLEVRRAANGGILEVRLLDDSPSPGRQALEEIEPVVRIRAPAGWAGHVELPHCLGPATQ